MPALSSDARAGAHAAQADSAHDIACDEALALLPLVADGGIDLARDPALFAHLARCVACQDALAQHDRIEIALRGGVGPVRRRVVRLRWLPLATAACLACVFGVLALRQTGETGNATAQSGSTLPTTQVSPDRRTPEQNPGLGQLATQPSGHAETTRVVRIPGDRPGTWSYVLITGDRMIVLDPREGDAQPPPDTMPAGFAY